jgi:membrane-associated phospholipid phosphatase
MNIANPNLFKRIALVLAVAAIQSIYFPTSQNGIGGIMPKIPWDVFPVYPIWIVVYLLCFPLWLICIIWSIWKMEGRLFRALIAASLFTVSIGIATFIIFPTYVDLPQVDGTDFLSSLLRQIQESGGKYDALPSGHLYITTLLALFFSRWYPRARLPWIGIVILVSLSTLFTGQHYILDVISGIVLAWLGYRFGLWWVMQREMAAVN